MKGKRYNLLRLKGLESEDAGFFFLALPGVNSGSENHFFAAGQEEQLLGQAGAAGASFWGTSFLADSL